MWNEWTIIYKKNNRKNGSQSVYIESDYFQSRNEKYLTSFQPYEVKVMLV